MGWWKMEQKVKESRLEVTLIVDGAAIVHAAQKSKGAAFGTTGQEQLSVGPR